ncbi:hypothetical protein ABPG72_012808 [Tetrahymena utriculariae]
MSNKHKKHKDEEIAQDIKSQLVEASINNLFGAEKKPQEQKVGCCPVLTVSFWSRYFNVTQSDVGQRIKSSLFLTPPFEEVMGGQPDLYGPFWIFTTIIALVSISANICDYLNNIGNDTQFKYRYDFVPVAATLIYGVGIICPTLLWVIVKLLFKVKIKLIQTICLYGYSQTCFLLISVLSIIPNNIAHWCLLGYGFSMSTLFFFRNLKKEMDELEPNQRYAIFGLVLGCQLILCLMFRFYFFKLTTLND